MYLWPKQRKTSHSIALVSESVFVRKCISGLKWLMVLSMTGRRMMPWAPATPSMACEGVRLLPSDEVGEGRIMKPGGEIR